MDEITALLESQDDLVDAQIYIQPPIIINSVMEIVAMKSVMLQL